MRHQWLITAALAAGFAPSAQIAYATEYLTAEAAQRVAFPDASAFEPVLIAADVRAAVARDAGRFAVEPRVWRVRAGDRTMGWFIVDEVIGKVELITYGAGARCNRRDQVTRRARLSRITRRRNPVGGMALAVRRQARERTR